MQTNEPIRKMISLLKSEIKGDQLIGIELLKRYISEGKFNIEELPPNRVEVGMHHIYNICGVEGIYKIKNSDYYLMLGCQTICKCEPTDQVFDQYEILGEL